MCCFLASGLENRRHLDALNNICFNLPPYWKMGGSVLEKNPHPLSGSFYSACAHWLWRVGVVALPVLWGAFWSHRCSPLLLFTSATLPSFGSHLAELPQSQGGRKARQCLASTILGLWMVLELCNLDCLGNSVLTRAGFLEQEVVLSWIGFEGFFPLALHQLIFLACWWALVYKVLCLALT